MNELSFHDWNKPERMVTFVGYNSARTVCYIYNEERARRAIDLRLPSGYGFSFAGTAIPAMAPDEICRSVLSLPSFGPFMPKADVMLYHLLKSRDTSAPAKDPVPLESLHPRKGNWDAPDLREKLRQALAEELQRRRNERAAVERQIAMLPDDKAKIARIHRLPDPKEIASDEATTLDDVNEGKYGLRAKVLQREFIEHHGLDPEEIGLDYLVFCRWIRLVKNRIPEQTLATLAARIRYRIHFKDNTVCWLESAYERALTTPQEQDDFGKQEEVPKSERLPLVEVLDMLASERKGRRVPMGLKGFEKLCNRERIDFEEVQKRGLPRSDVEKLLKKREGQRRSRITRLKNLNEKGAAEKSSPPVGHVGLTDSSPSDESEPEQQRIAVGGSLDHLDAKLREISGTQSP